ncbi:hypothetical protein I552_2631 [Mycobacterium xenopi 3993]|nr:hypothetical protein I552_2631 [Mycobacterium xenopi 3993]
MIAPSAAVLMLVPAAGWQRQVSALMGIPGPTTLSYLRTLVVASVVSAVLVATCRTLIDAIKLLARMLIRRWHLHDEVALFIGTTIVVALLITLINGVLVRGSSWGQRPLRAAEQRHRRAHTSAVDARKVR